MKKLILSAALLFATCALQAGAATITLSLASPVTVGGTFDVIVEATDVFALRPGDGLLAFGFQVTVDDPSILHFGSESVGPLFDDVSPNFLPDGVPSVVGIANLDSVFYSEGDFTEPLELAVLHFSALSGGTTGIHISSDPSNLNEGLVFLGGYEGISASVSAGAEAVPEPASFAVAGTGLAGLALLLGRRRKQQ